MTLKSKWALVPLAALTAVGLYAGNVLATPAGGQSTTTLGKALAADPVNLFGHAKQPGGGWRARLHTHGFSDFYVIDNKFTPGGTSGWHSHPGPSLIFVVAGQITNYLGNDPSCTPHVYSAGQSFTDEGGADVHMLRNNGSVDAETIAVQFLPKDAGRRIDEPDPMNCHF
jgi:quercetin dioxygenase-like cupin family protein